MFFFNNCFDSLIISSILFPALTTNASFFFPPTFNISCISGKYLFNWIKVFTSFCIVFHFLSGFCFAVFSILSKRLCIAVIRGSNFLNLPFFPPTLSKKALRVGSFFTRSSKFFDCINIFSIFLFPSVS